MPEEPLNPKTVVDKPELSGPIDYDLPPPVATQLQQLQTQLFTAIERNDLNSETGVDASTKQIHILLKDKLFPDTINGIIHGVYEEFAEKQRGEHKESTTGIDL
jgi:hypothetical protein